MTKPFWRFSTPVLVFADSPHTRSPARTRHEAEAASHWESFETSIERDGGLVRADYESGLATLSYAVSQYSSGAQHGTTLFILQVAMGFFTVGKKDGAQRLVCDARATKQVHRSAPRPHRGTPGALANLIENHENGPFYCRQTTDACTQFEPVRLAFVCSVRTVVRHTPRGLGLSIQRHAGFGSGRGAQFKVCNASSGTLYPTVCCGRGPSAPWNVHMRFAAGGRSASISVARLISVLRAPSASGTQLRDCRSQPSRFSCSRGLPWRRQSAGVCTRHHGSILK